MYLEGPISELEGDIEIGRYINKGIDTPTHVFTLRDYDRYRCTVLLLYVYGYPEYDIR